METDERDTVLLVEDDSITALAEAAAIRAYGYEVVVARSGEEAVRLAGGRTLDLVLMDVYLGKGMDGVETAFRLRETTDAPLVFLTSCAESEVVPRLGKLARWAFLPKGRIESLRSFIPEAMARLGRARQS
jgi:CheY-like chemotaxis protein